MLSIADRLTVVNPGYLCVAKFNKANIWFLGPSSLLLGPLHRVTSALNRLHIPSLYRPGEVLH